MLRDYGASSSSGAPVRQSGSGQKSFRYPRVGNATLLLTLLLVTKAGGRNPSVSLVVTALGSEAGQAVAVTPPTEIRSQ